jgi:hypothetical protein
LYGIQAGQNRIVKMQHANVDDLKRLQSRRNMITIDTLREKRDAVLQIARRYGASDIRIFGSLARGDTTEDSDVDLIVRFEPGRSLFDHGGLIMELQDLLGVRVDVISEGGMSNRFRTHVTMEAVQL